LLRRVHPIKMTYLDATLGLDVYRISLELWYPGRYAPSPI
jgi:hypothetical protein